MGGGAGEEASGEASARPAPLTSKKQVVCFSVWRLLMPTTLAKTPGY
jgi:hypothetical protein